MQEFAAIEQRNPRWRHHEVHCRIPAELMDIIGVGDRKYYALESSVGGLR